MSGEIERTIRAARDARPMSEQQRRRIDLQRKLAADVAAFTDETGNLKPLDDRKAAPSWTRKSAR